MQAMNVPVSIGVGGSFDVFSGNVKRAPRLVQKMNLEWLWRLIQNPKKWRKVMSLPTFWWMVIRSKR
jgi:N-acetylglucosaminyldiphosphoundecaprenol N-acetyl-beta-D-mannosaminyltransferase